MSVPNQKTIIIHQSKEIPFLKIGVSEVMEAYKNIQTKSAFVLFLYLASNADGFKLELSKEAFHNATGFSKSSYHRAVNKLIELGYIYEDAYGRLNFATKPKLGLRKAIQNWDQDDSKVKHPIAKNETEESQNWNEAYSEMNTEINNRYKTEKTKKTDTPSSSTDFSYLDDIVCYEDGSYVWDGKVQFIDGNNDPLFYERPRGYQEAKMAEITPFKMVEIQYILNKMSL